MIKTLLLSALLAFAPADQFARMLLQPAFVVTYAGTTSGTWTPSVGQQLPFINAAGGTWTLTVNRAGTTSLFTSGAGGIGGGGSLGVSGAGAGSAAYNAGGISLQLVPGKTYTITLGAYPGGSIEVVNTTDAITISHLTGGGNGSPTAPGGTAGAVLTGAGTAGTVGASGFAGTFCLGGGEDGVNGGAAGGSGGAANDGGTGAGCGGGGIVPLDGYTGGSGNFGVAAVICGSNVGGGGGGGGSGTTFGGAGADNRFLNSGQGGIACFQLVSVP